MQELGPHLLAFNLAKWVKHLAKEGMTPHEIRRLTIRDISRFYKEKVEMPAARKNNGNV
jgi:small-conductance mechanosensitive channel